MTIRTKLAALAGATALVVTGMTGVQVASAPPAAAASCTIETPKAWSVKNLTCTRAQHINVLAGGTVKRAPYVGKQSVSSQPVCWANMVQYGAVVYA